MKKLLSFVSACLILMSCEKEEIYNVEFVNSAMLDKHYRQVSLVEDTGSFNMLPKRFLIETLDTSKFFIAKQKGDSLYIAKKQCLKSHLYTDFDTAYIANIYRIVK